MQERCIVVLTVGRSGSSAVAGVLDRLGIKMAVHYMGANDANPKGFYEDVTLNRMLQQPLNLETLVSYFDERRKAGIWGMKDPALVYKFSRLKHLIGDFRIVIAKRDPEEVEISYKRVWNKINRAEIKRKEELIKQLIEDVPHIIIWYNELIDNTEQTIHQLRDFAYEGLDLELPDMQEAINFIDPDLYRCRKE